MAISAGRSRGHSGRLAAVLTAERLNTGPAAPFSFPHCTIGRLGGEAVTPPAFEPTMLAAGMAARAIGTGATFFGSAECRLSLSLPASLVGVARSRGHRWPKATAKRRAASLTAASEAPGLIRSGRPRATRDIGRKIRIHAGANNARGRNEGSR
jgi:hypothetical protein